MATVRQILREALRAIKAIAPGDDPTIDELNAGLEAFQQLMLEWHEARGPMTDVDVSADYVASANQRVRVQEGAAVQVTLPNAIPLFVNCSPTDYGFFPSSLVPQAGMAGPADGFRWRQPRDGERIEIIGASGQALYFFVADLNNWAPVYGLLIDSIAPVNSAHVAHWGAKLAERLIPSWPDLEEPTPALAKRIGIANHALFYRAGVARDPVTTEYF